MQFEDIDELFEFMGTMMNSPSPEATPLTELDHALQCAAELERRHPDDVELQLAGLVHDIARRTGPAADHGRRGAEAVRRVMGDRVAALVEAHIPAKRYLIATDPSYRAALSPVASETLTAQGGAFGPDEVAAFEALPYWREAVELRRADEAAKVPGRVVPGLGHWIMALRQLGAARRAR